MAPLQELFETHAIVKILDFLTTFKDFEYTKTDIAKETEISRRTLYEVFPILEKFELVTNTRSFGQVNYYKLNSNSSICRLLTRLADEIALFNAEKETGIKLTSDIE
jgi:predicted regulator of amino acid metabolism with ACT domain